MLTSDSVFFNTLLRLVTDLSTYLTSGLRLSRCSFVAVRVLDMRFDVVEAVIVKWMLYSVLLSGFESHDPWSRELGNLREAPM